jgi:hypothetical protein
VWAAKQRDAVTGGPPFHVRVRRRFLDCCATTILALMLAGPAHAQAPSRSQFGSIGLIDMPSARMAPDGELSTSAIFFENSQRYVLGFQALPWLETSFRYSGLQQFNPSFPVYYDRAFGLKVRLWDESGLMPAFAVGTSDLVGTGVYSGEYIVASKRIGDLDFTLGMGWGRQATANTLRNPLSLLSSSFDARNIVYGQGGTFDFDTYFHGPNVGIFGGVAWQTPIENLTLLVEYSSDRYVEETLSGNFRPRSQVNLGASYQPFDGVTLGLGWLYGRSVYGNLTLSLDPRDTFPQRIGPTLPPLAVRTQEEQAQSLQAALERRSGGPAHATVDTALVDLLWNTASLRDVTLSGRTLQVDVQKPAAGLCSTIARQIAPHSGDITEVSVNGGPSCAVPGAGLRRVATVRQAMMQPASAEPLVIDATGPARRGRGEAEANIRRRLQEQNIALLALSLGDGEALVYYQNNYYGTEREAIERLLRILMAEAPAEVETIRLFPVQNGVPLSMIEIPRGTAERSFNQQGSFDIFRDQGRHLPAPMENPVLRNSAGEKYPKFNWSIFPQFRQQLFDPINPFGVQFLMAADFNLELLPGLRLLGQLEANLYNNFTTVRRSDSVLPHVRTDFNRYFVEGQNGIGYLGLEHNFRLAPSTYVTLRAGYLESMFAGVGGEILFQPPGQRWALGADLYAVQQRDFNRLFGLQSYRQTTGHMTLYYDSPWYNLDFAFRIGRYLAGDWGTTVQVTRRFASGVEIGVFATKTNVSATQFGEGSFDKGIILRIPLGRMVPIHTQQFFAMDLRPVQRDGGQVLFGDAQLHGRLRRASEGELRRTAGY